MEATRACTARSNTPMSLPELDFALHRDAFGRLVLTRKDGTQIPGVVPIRAFPLTAPDEHLGLVDEAGREVVAVRRLSALPKPLVALIEEELARREFVPQVLEILEISKGSDPTHWRVRTDRGEVNFLLPAAESIRPLGEEGFLIADDHGIRYRIVDRRALPKASQRLLRRFV